MTVLLIILRIGFILFLLGLRSEGKQVPEQPGDTLAHGCLIPATATMQRAWEIPWNPLIDSSLENSSAGEQIQYGYKVFTNTPYEAPGFSGNSLSCSHCHLNAGQREKALPLVGVISAYPEYNKRAGRQFTLDDRIIECFKRSLDGSRVDRIQPTQTAGESTLVRLRESKEVAAIAAYIRWLSCIGTGENKIPWRGQNSIPPINYIPVDRLDTARGRLLYSDKCINCHRVDGQGVFIGDKKAGPLWGEESWNDGAGAARVYTLAGIIRYMMPYLDPGSLTDEEAQNIAAFIDTQDRPSYPYKARDYPGAEAPADALYYKHDSKK
jgi:thiosulfate dehydrogenase